MFSRFVFYLALGSLLTVSVCSQNGNSQGTGYLGTNNGFLLPQHIQIQGVIRNNAAVFSPQEPVIVDFTLNGIKNSGKLTLNVVLTQDSPVPSKPLAESELPISEANAVLPVSFIAPDNDGIYTITATLKSNNPVFDLRLNRNAPAVRFQQQFAVINPKLPPRADGDLTLAPVKQDLLDPAENFKRKKSFLSLTAVPIKPSLRIPQFGLGKKEESPFVPESETALQLPVPVKDPGRPIQIEVEYPNDEPLRIGVSVFETINDRQKKTYGTEINVDEEVISVRKTETTAVHKILYWAKTKRPVLVLSDLSHPHQTPDIRNVRVAEILPVNSEESGRLPKQFEGDSQRKFFGVVNILSQSENLDYESLRQFTETLCHNGYDGVMFSVVAGNVRLPNEKLEILLRFFDRDNLILVPVVEVNTLEEQNALPNTMQELDRQFGHHSSFGKIAVLNKGLWSVTNSPFTALFIHPFRNGMMSVPADYQNRSRFVKQFAQNDVLTFFDGGERLPLGEQDALTDLLASYRKLPPQPFKTYVPAGSADKNAPVKSLQPLTVRYLNTDKELYVYLVNDAPYLIEAEIEFVTDLRTELTELSGRRMIRALNSKVWRASLLPFDFIAVKLNDRNAVIQNVSVMRPPELCGENGRFKEKVEELGQRIYAARDFVWDKLPNADFEENGQKTENNTGIANWQRDGSAAFDVFPDTVTAYSGKSSAKLVNTSTEAGIFYSDSLSPPQTGLLRLAAFVGVPENAAEIPLNIVLSAEHNGETFYRYASVGASLQPHLAKIEPKNGIRWHQVVVPFEQLPTENFENVRIGFQMTSPGTLWIDDVKLYPIVFFRNEMLEFQKMLVAADTRLKQERFSELLTLLESGQSRYVFRNVTLPMLVPKPVTAEAAAPVAQDVAKPEAKPTVYQRVKGWFGSK